MGHKHLKLDSVDCESLIYGMGEYRCLDRMCRISSAEFCYRCKFQMLRMREEKLRKEREHECKY